MNEPTRLSIQLDISAQKVLHHLILHNKDIEKQVEEGIKQAIAEIDIIEVVKNAAKEQLKKAINDSQTWENFRKVVRQKADKIIEDHIEKEMESWKSKI